MWPRRPFFPGRWIRRARFRSGESRPFCKKVLGLHRNQPAVLLSLPLTPSPPQHRRRSRRLVSPPSCPPPAGPPASLRPSPPSSRYAPPLEPSSSRDVPAPREPVVAPSACRSRLAQRTAGSLCSSFARRPSAQRQKSGHAQLARRWPQARARPGRGHGAVAPASRRRPTTEQPRRSDGPPSAARPGVAPQPGIAWAVLLRRRQLPCLDAARPPLGRHPSSSLPRSALCLPHRPLLPLHLQHGPLPSAACLPAGHRPALSRRVAAARSPCRSLNLPLFHSSSPLPFPPCFPPHRLPLSGSSRELDSPRPMP